MKINKKEKKGALAISQILILIIGIIAVSYAVGSQIGEVSANAVVPPVVTIPATTPPIIPTIFPPIVHAGGTTAIEGGNIIYTVVEDDWLLEIGNRFGIGWEKLAENPLNKKVLADPNLIHAGDKIIIPTPEKAAALGEPAAGATPGVGSKIVNPFGKGGFLKTVMNTAYHAIVVAAITYVVVRYVFGESPELSEDLALSAGGGWFVGELAYHGSKYLATKVGFLAFLGPWAVPIGIGAGIYTAYKIISNVGEKADTRSFTFECKYWQAERGGNNCGKCNNQDFPCTEYQCMSLGGGCVLINKNTDDPACIWNNSRDITPPDIRAWTEGLSDNYCYKPLQGVRGVEVKYDENAVGGACSSTAKACLPAFAPFSFGIDLDKLGYCKMDNHLTNNFTEMLWDFGGVNSYILTQEQWLTFPGVAYLEAEGVPVEIHNDGNYEFYVRCENPNGHANTEEFLFKFCIESGPDYTEPIIRKFIPADKTPITFLEADEPHEVDVEIHINKPTECKWSHNDRDYKDMEYEMDCPGADSVFNFNAEMVYPCYGNLTGLENRKENKFYFRCNSSYFGVVNKRSNILTLIGTQPLVISSAEPNNTIIRGSSDSIKVTLEATTSAGYQDGTASCAYSTTGHYDDYTVFDNTNSHQHSTDIWLDAGDYNYSIQCLDLAGNFDTTIINFTVEKDTRAPIVVRVYKESNNLKIITDESAECVYDVVDCTYVFDDGLAMQSYDETNHFTDWDSDKTFYIKCQDEYGNQPVHNKCSITVKPFEI